MQYEVFIPAPDENGFDVTLVVEAHNWMAALKTGLERCGEGAHAVRSVVCDIQADNSVHVTDAGSMRVFRLKPLPEPAPTPPPDRPTLERPTEALPTLQAHAPAFTAPIPILTQAIYQVEVSTPAPRPAPEPEPAPEPAPEPEQAAAPAPEPEPETVLVPPPEPTPTLPSRAPSPPDLAALDAVALPLEPPSPEPPPLASPPSPELPADLNKVTAPVPANFREVLARELAHELTQPPAQAPAPEPKVILAQPTTPTPTVAAPTAAPPLEAPPAPRTFHPTSRTIIGEMPAVHFGQARISSQAKEKGVVSTPDSGTIARVLREQHTHSGADLKARPTIQIGRIDIQTQVADNALEDVFLEIPPIFDGMSIAEAADFVLNLAMDKIRSESGSILFTTSKGDELFFATTRGPKAADVKDYRIPMGEGVAGFCAREGVCLLIADVKSDLRFYEAISRSMGYEVTSLLCAPIQYQRRVYGCIELINPTDRSTYSHAQLNALKYMGEEFGQMIMETHMRQE